MKKKSGPPLEFLGKTTDIKFIIGLYRSRVGAVGAIWACFVFSTAIGFHPINFVTHPILEK